MLSTILISVISVLMAVDTLILIWIAARGRKFLRQHPRLETEEDFREYQRLVTDCMKLTFTFIILFNSSVLICCVGTGLAWIHVPDLNSVAFFGIVRMMGAVFMSVIVEGRLKDIPTVDSQLSEWKQELIDLWDAEYWPRRAYLVGMDAGDAAVE